MRLKLLPLRYDPKVIDPQVNGLLAKLRELPEYQAVRLTGSHVLRMALNEGLAVLAKRHPDVFADTDR